MVRLLAMIATACVGCGATTGSTEDGGEGTDTSTESTSAPSCEETIDAQGECPELPGEEAWILDHAPLGDPLCADRADCLGTSGAPDHKGCPNTCGCLCVCGMCYEKACTAMDCGEAAAVYR